MLVHTDSYILVHTDRSARFSATAAEIFYAVRAFQARSHRGCVRCTSQMTTLSSFAKMFGTSPELSMLLMSSTKDSLMIWVSENRKAIGVLQPSRNGVTGTMIAENVGHEAYAATGGGVDVDAAVDDVCCDLR